MSPSRSGRELTARGHKLRVVGWRDRSPRDAGDRSRRRVSFAVRETLGSVEASACCLRSPDVVPHRARISEVAGCRFGQEADRTVCRTSLGIVPLVRPARGPGLMPEIKPALMPEVKPAPSRRRGMTLVEFLVVITIIGVLLTLILFPAVRSIARGGSTDPVPEQSQADSAVALHNYHDIHNSLPSGWTGRRLEAHAVGVGWSGLGLGLHSFCLKLISRPWVHDGPVRPDRSSRSTNELIRTAEMLRIPLSGGIASEPTWLTLRRPSLGCPDRPCQLRGRVWFAWLGRLGGRAGQGRQLEG